MHNFSRTPDKKHGRRKHSRNQAHRTYCNFNFEIRDFEGKSPQDLTHTRDLMEIERKMDFKERERNGFKCCL